MHSQSDQQSQSDVSSESEVKPHFATPPSHASIAALAHQLWERRGRPEGSPETDWYEAERMYEGEQA